jgi:NDP-sugar pyrophosphorylase family protein
LKISYSFEDTPLGTAGPLALIDGLTETFLVTNGDVLTTLEITKLLEFHRSQQGIATIATHQRKVHIDLGVIHADGDNRILSYTEKPTLNYLVSMGMYVFEPEALKYVPKGKYLDFPDLVKLLIRSGEKVTAYPFDGYWQDLGRPDDYEQASIDFDSMRTQFLPGEDD